MTLFSAIDLDRTTYADQTQILSDLIATAKLDAKDRQDICDAAAQLVRDIRAAAHPGLMEVFLAEYGLSTEEGIALMCLAEALLRVPDAYTMDALIEDKIAPSDWGRHMGHSTSPLVNASTWALMLTGRVLADENPGVVGHLHSAIRRLGEPVIRTAATRAMKEMGRQFVLGESITSAMKRAKTREEQGYTYSYDMLGEAARTDADATRYHLAYSRAITAIAEACTSKDIRQNPGISVKLSALHPRYEVAQRDQVMDILVPRLRSLALLAKSAKMGLNIDAEEADRLSLSLEVIETVLSEPALKGWDGFGIVVQAYGPRASSAIDTLYEMATRLDRKLMIRLVKGAYWDTEVKRAQVAGLDGFPVFTSKAATDVSYIANARKLLGMTDRIYPQFATHNAHTAAAILHMADDPETYEFQRLHGMGEALHDLILKSKDTRCRIYAPVGAHRDLLAYLVRRLLENGANSSFVNQIVDESIAPEVVAADPFEDPNLLKSPLQTGPMLFAPSRQNSRGFDLRHLPTLADITQAMAPFQGATWNVAPLLAGRVHPNEAVPCMNPARGSDVLGTAQECSAEDIETASSSSSAWTAAPKDRRAVLKKAADLYEENFGELFAVLTREAGKTLMDAVAELREAVDFLRYYANQTEGQTPVGVFTCISPWNFPLAIFTGQIAAALAAGNGVIAKPAEQTPIIAAIAVRLLHQAGVPTNALQLCIGDGRVGAALTTDPRIGGVAFTGSTETALKIRASMADHLIPGAPFIAETGGLNAMIVDSTALPEQAVAAVIESAFQSAGQRCSALRCLYVQEDIAEDFLEMLTGAVRELTLGDPWHLSTDIGPVIDAEARDSIAAYIDAARGQGRVIFETDIPSEGTFVAPTIIRVNTIKEMDREIFGPVLHIATFKPKELDQIIRDINGTGYGLTFGLQTRIDDRVQEISDQIHCGNIYVNRNQIGAIVGSQPFGGDGLSGTGPKAGGPLYIGRFAQEAVQPITTRGMRDISLDALQDRINAENATKPKILETHSLPGPTGEENQLRHHARDCVLCLGPSQSAAEEQAQVIRDLGGIAVAVDAHLAPEMLEHIQGISSVIWWGDRETARAYDQALAKRSGPIIALVATTPDKGRAILEKHVCIDTTAAGGNAALLAGMS
jgi:RHH-type proline utilization regulon transcriptional repressor/proline dehydrogenase/delta 1-pyrroline-5-carboxylate dehydrogenase